MHIKKDVFINLQVTHNLCMIVTFILTSFILELQCFEYKDSLFLYYLFVHLYLDQLFFISFVFLDHSHMYHLSLLVRDNVYPTYLFQRFFNNKLVFVLTSHSEPVYTPYSKSLSSLTFIFTDLRYCLNLFMSIPVTRTLRRSVLLSVSATLISVLVLLVVVKSPKVFLDLK